MALEPLPLLLFIAGFVLIILEAFAPGAHFVVLGTALFSAGLLGIFLGLGPIALAASVLLVGVLAFYGYREFDFYGSEAGRTSDSSSLVGQTGRVTQAVSTSGGEIKLEDGGFNPFYQARTMDGRIEEGEEVMVLDGGGGNVVTVEPTGGRSELDRQLDRDAAQSRSEEATDTDEPSDTEELEREEE